MPIEYKNLIKWCDGTMVCAHSRRAFARGYESCADLEFFIFWDGGGLFRAKEGGALNRAIVLFLYIILNSFRFF